MNEVFKVTPQMEEELEQEIATLAHDTPREVFGVPRFRRRTVGAAHSESLETPPANHSEPPPSAEVDATDPINHPKHYTSHPSGVECITVTEWMSFNLGSAVKYIWRAGMKGYQIEDLQKARWYIDRELKRLGAEQ